MGVERENSFTATGREQRSTGPALPYPSHYRDAQTVFHLPLSSTLSIVTSHWLLTLRSRCSQRIPYVVFSHLLNARPCLHGGGKPISNPMQRSGLRYYCPHNRTLSCCNPDDALGGSSHGDTRKLAMSCLCNPYRIVIGYTNTNNSHFRSSYALAHCVGTLLLCIPNCAMIRHPAFILASSGKFCLLI
jgi:hypothetical protein